MSESLKILGSKIHQLARLAVHFDRLAWANQWIIGLLNKAYPESITQSQKEAILSVWNPLREAVEQSKPLSITRPLFDDFLTEVERILELPTDSLTASIPEEY